MTIDDETLLSAFEGATLPNHAFKHLQHVRVAWLYVTRLGMPAAIEAFSAALRRFADVHGVPTLYHETITWAFLLIIAERQARRPASDWEGFATTNGDLLVWKPSILDRYYQPETLASDLARRAFVWPDRLSG